VEKGENGETSAVVVEDIFVGFDRVGIFETIENGETDTVSIDERYNLTPSDGLSEYVDDGGVGLTDNGWEEFTDQVTFVTNSDGSVSCDNAVVTCEISNVQVIDLDELDIASVMENYSQDGALWRKVLQSGVSFSEGSKGYSAEITTGVEYTIDTSINYTSFSGQPPFLLEGISDLINAPGLPFDIEGAITSGVTPGFIISVSKNFESKVDINLKADGTADYFIVKDGGWDPQLLDTITVNYTLETINQVQIVRLPRVDLPSGLEYFDGNNEGDLVLSVFDGDLVFVDVEQAQTAPVLLLDSAANQELIDAIDLEKLSEEEDSSDFLCCPV
jgi:hypothetical protein